MDFFSSVASRTRRQRQLNGGASGSGAGNGGRRENGASGSEASSVSRGRKRTRSRSGAENGGSSSVGRRRKERRLQRGDVLFLGESVDEEKEVSVSHSSQRFGSLSSSIGPELDGYDSVVPELNKGKRVIDYEDDDQFDKGKRVVDDDSDSVEAIEIDEGVSDSSDEERLVYGESEVAPSYEGNEEVEVIELDDDENEEVGVEENGDKGENFNSVDLGEERVEPVSDKSVPIEEEQVEAGPDAMNWGFDKSNPIELTENSADSDADADDVLTSTESEDDNSDDDDYRVDESESSSCEDASVSYCDDSDEESDEEEISEAGVDDDSVGNKAGGKRKKKSSQLQSKKFEYFDDDHDLGESMPTMEEQGRKVETESSGICRNNGDNTAVMSGEQQVQNVSKDAGLCAFMSGEQMIDVASSTKLPEKEANKAEEEQEAAEVVVEEQEDIPSLVNNDQCVEQSNEKVQDACKDVAHSGVICGELQMNLGSSTKPSEKEARRAEEKQEAKAATAERLSVDSFTADAKVFGGSLKNFGTGPVEGKFVGKRKRPSFSCNAERLGTEHVDTGHPNVGMSKNQKEMGPSRKIFKRVEDVNKGKEVQETKKDGKTDKKEGKFIVKEKLSSSNDLHLIGLLADCILGKRNASKNHPIQFEIEVDDAQQQEAEPPSSEETLPLKFTFRFKEPEPVEKSEFEKDLDRLWEELDTVNKLEEAGAQVGKEETKPERGYIGTPAILCSQGIHEYFIDEEIGIRCRFCPHIAMEIRYVSPLVEENFSLVGSGQRLSSGEVDIPLYDGLQFKASGGSSEAVFNHSGGTVWDIIPDVKENLHPHQQEGFEFIWTNLTGATDLHKLKSADPNSVGGCIISHAPGTGKTRLTIVFLQSYLELFPLCHPVIIAPASVLLTWEDEFRKWDIGIPFHNLSNPELSGKELMGDSNRMKGFRCHSLKRDAIRMFKLLSWCQQKSILGISYNLYEKIAGENTKAKTAKQSEVIRKVLREIPSLLVLDEGHIPRNKRSQIFKVLSEIKTEKRILLSGTPFQNNFLELYNILCLVKPSFPDRIPEDLKKFCQSKRLTQEKKRLKQVRWKEVTNGNSTGYSDDLAIDELKLLMAPFVHVHKGSILQKSLPGLRDCVVILNPGNMQKQTLESIQFSQNALKFEHKLALVSIHPSLFLHCILSEKEKSLVNRDLLEQLRPDPYEGVKTRFLVDFIRLCEAVKEKVIVFSQFIDPLNLIMDHLHSLFKWSAGKEVLHMHGKLDQKQRQSLIHNFNDSNSKAKILLASTRACSEGINLTGASRVVLLDVVWNPSVERQAISRAYRLGQEKVVYTYHLITKDTDEWRKYHTQAEKDRISERVFSARKNENDKQKRSVVAQEDKVLDEMVQHEKLKDMFDSIIYQPKEKLFVESFRSVD